MQMQRTVDAAPPIPESKESTLVIPPRSLRRATARRASRRRATARRHKVDIEGRIIGYLQAHPRSTTGAIAKGVNADRSTVGASVSHMFRSDDTDMR